MLTTILVSLDGSVQAERALSVAETLARGLEGRVVLVRPVQVPTSSRADAREVQSRALCEAQKYLDAHASRLTTSGLTVETAVACGEPATQILNQASLRKADMIVMPSRRRSGVGRWLEGTVADQVLRRAPVPVVLVPAGTGTAWPTARPVILVPLDGSQLAEGALGLATVLATRLDADVVLLQVVSVPPFGMFAERSDSLALDPAAELRPARAYLADLGGRLGPDVHPARIRVEVGHPANCISRVAAEEGADLICMATHGRSGIARVVLGSVATGVLRQTHIPLLLVRPVPSHERLERTAPSDAAAAKV